MFQRVIEPLAGDVSDGVAVPHRSFGTEESHVASCRAAPRFTERRGDKDAEIPQVEQLAPEQEDAVEQQDRVGGPHLGGLDDRLVRPEVEYASPVSAVAARPKWIQQRGSERGVVERVAEVALRRLGSTGEPLEFAVGGSRRSRLE